MENQKLIERQEMSSKKLLNSKEYVRMEKDAAIL